MLTPQASDTASRAWSLVGLCCILLVFLGLRFGTSLVGSPQRWDEQYITVPMFDIIDQGWSVETAIDFQETKGPALIWPYAMVGGWLGGSLDDLRLVSGLCFVLSAVPLLLLAWRCGARRLDLLLAVVGFILLPYELIFGQLVMGEASFIFGSLWLLLIVLWGLGDHARSPHPVAGPILYCLLLAILLHSRIHVVAWAGAVCLVAFQRDGLRSWPWWVASIAGGLLRVPLWHRWGGLVSPEYANLHGLGFRLESVVYLGAALLPLAAVFLLVFLVRYRRCVWWFLCPLGGAIGLCLSMLAIPDLTIPAGQIDLSVMHDRYQGIAATMVTTIAGEGAARSVLLGCASAVGFASLGALGALAMAERPDGRLAALARMQFWVLCVGIGLYAFTRGFVFDRFLVIWAVGLPILWVRWLPRWLLAVQLLGLLAIGVKMVLTWLS